MRTKMWVARVALVLLVGVLVGAAMFGLYEARSGPAHIWPVHSHHLLVLMAVLITWIVLGLIVLVLLCGIIVMLWKASRW
jgi:hypothetical protein